MVGFGVGVAAGWPKKENHGFEVGFGVILGVLVGVTLTAVLAFGRLSPFRLILPLATTINTATTTRPRMNDKTLLN